VTGGVSGPVLGGTAQASPRRPGSGDGRAYEQGEGGYFVGDGAAAGGGGLPGRGRRGGQYQSLWPTGL